MSTAGNHAAKESGSKRSVRLPSAKPKTKISPSSGPEAELHKPVERVSSLAAIPDFAAPSPPVIVEAAEKSRRRLDRQRDRTMTVKEAAFRLGKSEDAIYKWLRTGRLLGWQPGGRWCSILVLESSVDEALQCGFERDEARIGHSQRQDCSA